MRKDHKSRTQIRCGWKLPRYLMSETDLLYQGEVLLITHKESDAACRFPSPLVLGGGKMMEDWDEHPVETSVGDGKP